MRAAQIYFVEQHIYNIYAIWLWESALYVFALQLHSAQRAILKEPGEESCLPLSNPNPNTLKVGGGDDR